MTTRPPAAVQTFPDTSDESIAYASVASIPVREPNDRTRLGYHVWQYLHGKIPTLEEAIRGARGHMLITEQEAIAIIRKALPDSTQQTT